MYTVKTITGREVKDINSRAMAIHKAKELLLNVFVSQTYVIDNATGEITDSFKSVVNPLTGKHTSCGCIPFDIVRAW